MEFLLPVLIIGCSIGAVFLVRIFQLPGIGVFSTLIFSFVMPMAGRELMGIPIGIGIEALLFVTWIAVLMKNQEMYWQILKNDLFFLTTAWFVLSLLELFNPAGASPMGWLQEIRNSALHAMLIIPLTFLLCDRVKALDFFLVVVIGVSVLGSINGLRQLKIGLTPGEKVFVEEMASTHLIWGKLRVFSFFTDAGQFGASQAHIALMASLLALAPFKLWVRLLLLGSSFILLVGMLVSGTRGALFVLIFGAFYAVFLFKNFKMLAAGMVFLVLAVGVLKYTHIGDGNYQIYRIRTALDPQDASLNLRFTNQKILANYLKDKPFGGGLGVIGIWGHEYNPDKFLSTIEPDSYWVKVWAMYGIVGFVLYFCMTMYILGKCGGIVWRIEDDKLRIRLVALTAGAFGVFMASYGNEVINRVPSSLVVYMSWAFIYMGPIFDQQVKDRSKSINLT